MPLPPYPLNETQEALHYCAQSMLTYLTCTCSRVRVPILIGCAGVSGAGPDTAVSASELFQNLVDAGILGGDRKVNHPVAPTSGTGTVFKVPNLSLTPATLKQ